MRLYDCRTMASPIEEGVSWASSKAVRKSMQGNKSRDTKPEMVVRRYLHSEGLRYRVHVRPIKDWNRRADIVFPKAKIAVFVNGCFWHGCPKHFVAPKSNVDYWIPKIKQNVGRDQETRTRLKANGWRVFVIWEHEDLVKRASTISGRIRHQMDKPPGPTPKSPRRRAQ